MARIDELWFCPNGWIDRKFSIFRNSSAVLEKFLINNKTRVPQKASLAGVMCVGIPEHNFQFTEKGRKEINNEFALHNDSNHSF